MDLVGPVVHVQLADEDGYLILLVEDFRAACWRSYKLNASSYGRRLNMANIDNDNLNSIFFAFFPRKYKWDCIEPLTAQNILAGFIRVQHIMKERGSDFPWTSAVHHLVEASSWSYKVPALTGTIVFSDEYRSNPRYIQQWISTFDPKNNPLKKHMKGIVWKKKTGIEIVVAPPGFKCW